MATRSISDEFVVLHQPHQAINEWRLRYDSWLSKQKYLVTQQSSDTISYTRSYIPGLAIVLAIILFPIGLLALLARREHVLSMVFEPHPSGSRVRVSGTGAPARLAQLQGVIDAHRNKLQAPSTASPAPSTGGVEWQGIVIPAAIAAAAVGVLVVVLFKRPVAAGAVLAGIAFVVFLPLASLASASRRRKQGGEAPPPL